MSLSAALGDSVTLAKETYSEWGKDKASRLAASLAYYALFALAPLLVIAIAVAGMILGESAVRGQLLGQIEGIVGPGSARLIQTMIANAAENTSGGIIATLVGFAILLFGASSLFSALEDALNTVWDVKPQKTGGLMEKIKDRILAFVMVLGVGFLLLAALVASTTLAAVVGPLASLLPGGWFLWWIVNFLLSLGIITLAFAAIYKVLPDVEIAWSNVWIGAAATALLFVIGKELIGLYLGVASVGSTFGAAASVIVLLVWIYYSAQILLFGAEFTHVYADKYGTRTQPAARAQERVHEQPVRTVRPSHGEVSAGGYAALIVGALLGWMISRVWNRRD